MAVKVDFTMIGEETMHCGGCETRVRFALQQLAGVREVLPNAKTQQIAVVIEPNRVTAEERQARLKVAGFEAIAATC
jgi:copper chaperone